MSTSSIFDPKTEAFLQNLEGGDSPRPPLLETMTEAEAGRELRYWAPAKALLELTRTAELFHDERNEAWIRVREGGRRMQFGLPSEGFRNWLAARYHMLCERTVTREQAERVNQVLTSQALYQSPMHPLFNRSALRAAERAEPSAVSMPAGNEDEPAPVLITDELPELWLDLHDHRERAVRVGAQGWEIVDEPPPLFRRFRHQHALPAPEAGDMEALFRLLPLEYDSERILLLAWLTMAAYPFRPCPMLCLHGPQGAAKTTTARMLRELIDPSASDNFDFQTQFGHLPEILDHHAVPVFDNVGSLNKAQANLLCRAVTGGSWSKRKLYSDNEEVVFRFRRPLILTALEVPCAATDWLERALLLPLDPLPPERRREEHRLWAEFAQARPRLLGGLLDIIAAAMRHWPAARQTHLPRMADFARWGVAVALAQGKTGADFLRILADNRIRQSHEVIAGDALAESLVQLMQQVGEFRDTASKLLETLSLNYRGPKGKNWPGNAIWLTRKLHSLKSVLSDYSIELKFIRQNDTRIVELSYRPE